MKLIKTFKSRSGDKLKSLLGAGICIGALLCASADAPAWPDTFWTQVSNHIAAVTPTGTQVGDVANPVAFSSVAFAALPGEAFGTVQTPFDSVCWFHLFTGTLRLDVRPPFGMTINFK